MVPSNDNDYHGGNIIHADFQGHDITFTEDGWFNATRASAKFGKEPVAWLRLSETAEYMAAVAEAKGNSGILTEFNLINGLDTSSAAAKAKFLRLAKRTGLVRTKSGGTEAGGGTWLHPKLAVPFARWLDVRFAVWCDEQIDNLIRAQGFAPEYLPTYHGLHDRVKELAEASSNGKFVHMNFNKLVNKTVGIGPGERPVLPMAKRSLVVVAQNLALDAMNGCADHHDGYTKAKSKLESLRAVLEPPKAA